MKKIVIDARIINSSTGRYVERLLTYLQKIDTTNQYIVLVPKKDFDYWKPTNNNFSVQECNYKNYSFGEQFGFAMQLYKLKADLVHFCMPQQPILYLKPHVTNVHDLTLLKTYNSDKNWLIYHIKQVIGRGVFWIIGRTSKKIIAISENTKNEYVKFAGINKNKVAVTYLATDTAAETPKKIDLPYKKFIMYVGSQSDYKNIKRLVLAHQELLKTRPELGLVLVGGLNDIARINKAWVEKNNYKNVYFAGFVPDEQLDWIYKHTEVYVFPSLMEGFGLPPLEAMAQGAPVVSSNATCLPEINGDAAHYFDPESVDDMASKIDDVLSDEKLRSDLITKGYRQVKKYSWTKTAEQTLDVYKKALSNNK
ncbi:MAG: glycosyltransferase family 1 protein [Candidatus Saccharibacteria bacterium]|nr:glycosyltransferase family 1 protein [Candidatus Saccharibacteria bacterium]